MHATTKSTTLGVAGVLLAALLYLRFLGLSSGLKESLILGFLFLTAPVGAHMIARAAYRAGVPLWQSGVVDEFKQWQETSARQGVDNGSEGRDWCADVHRAQNGEDCPRQ
jgi:monovalent cation/proton antiporter MnhG/PhaG subunit